MAPAALRHRLILNFEAEAEGITTDHIIEQVLKDVPMSAAVNAVRKNERSSTSLSVRTSNVLPRPGTPSSSTCPPENSAMSVLSTMRSWPTMELKIFRAQRGVGGTEGLDLRFGVQNNFNLEIRKSGGEPVGEISAMDLIRAAFAANALYRQWHRGEIERKGNGINGLEYQRTIAKCMSSRD